MSAFKLRAMEPTDGPAIDALLRHEAGTTSVGITTHYKHDIYGAFLAQQPTFFGVVAESPTIDGLAGIATAYVGEVTIGGRVYPSAHLENLKVHHDARRQGLGGRLAAWRIDEAQRRLGGEGVIATGVDATNAASLATARRWATQVLGPARVVIARTSSKRPPSRGIEVRPVADADIDAVIDGSNAFYDDYDLVPHQTPASLAGALATTGLGEPIRAYRVAVAGDGTIVAGALVTERFKLLVDHIDSIPLPVAILGRVTGMLPPDRIIRSVELGLAWHALGRTDALRAVWDAIRFEWHDRANAVAGEADPRGSLIECFRAGRSFAPKVELMAPVRSSVRLDPDRLLYMGR